MGDAFDVFIRGDHISISRVAIGLANWIEGKQVNNKSI